MEETKKKFNWRNLLVYLLSGLVLLGFVYYLIILPKSGPGDSGVPLKAIYGY